MHGHTGPIRHAHPLPRRRSPAIVALAAAVALAACSGGDGDPTAVDRVAIPDTTAIPDDGDDDEPDTDPDVGDPDPHATTVEPTTTTEVPEGALRWTQCDDDSIDDALQCATLEVPLDHDASNGETIDIALVRLAASGDRIGAVLFNPGGPGGSGVDFTASVATYASTEMGLRDFDLVGFDPRGVDRSNGLRCLDDAELDGMLFARADDSDTPDTPDEPGDDGDVVAGEIDDERFAEACRAAFGDTLQHYSTLATARDMDLIREALGDDTMSYIGISYGTYLGAAYATLFPDRVRALVLDSAFEPTDDSIEQRYLTQLVGFEEAFDAWAADCQGDVECAFTSDDVAGAWDALRDELDENPVAHVDGRAADASLLETATISALYDQLTWPRLSSALAETTQGDPTGLFELADRYLGRSADGTFSTIQQSNPIISCASGFGAAVPDDPEAFAQLIRDSAPRWGRDDDADSFGDRCADLVPPVDLEPFGFTGDAPIVVIGGVNDPATPFRWSEEMVTTLGPTSTLVTWNGEGHGQLFGSSCLLDIAGALLVDLEPPAPDTVCDPDPAVERPAFWDDLPIPDGVDPEPLPPEALNLLGLPPSLVYGEARTSTLGPDELLDAYTAALEDLGYDELAREEPVPGLILASFFTPDFEVISVVVVTDEAYDDDELAPAARLVGEGETLFALIYFPI